MLGSDGRDVVDGGRLGEDGVRVVVGQRLAVTLVAAARAEAGREVKGVDIVRAVFLDDRDDRISACRSGSTRRRSP